MKTKERVLATLMSAGGSSISGEKLASELGVTRAAVWKAVGALKEEGYEISGATKRGYSLDSAALPLTAAAIAESGLDPEKIRVFATINSTNTEAKRLASEGAPHGTAVVADRQTEGRGRYGKSFYSPAGTGLYMSVILRPGGLNLVNVTSLTAAAAVAVCRAVKELTGAELAIKWVNDLFYGEKKVAGILTEASASVESGGVDWAVVGIGINLTTENFPPELEATAGALGKNAVGIRSALAGRIIKILADPVFLTGTDAVFTEYRKRLMWVGERVNVSRAGDIFSAVFRGIDDGGALVVEREDGSTEVLTSGEIKRIE